MTDTSPETGTDAPSEAAAHCKRAHDADVTKLWSRCGGPPPRVGSIWSS
ncbi:hypothetical protein ABIA38_007980 [Embleya sp. AB8]